MEDQHLQHATVIESSDIREMMIHYGEDVWNYAYGLTRDAYLADDIAQETFIKAYRRFHTFRGEASVRTWLLKITRNTAFTYKSRAFFRRVSLFDSQTDRPNSPLVAQAAPSAETEAIDGETKDEVWSAVLQLPDKFRDPLLLRFHHQLSMEEIADVLGISIGTVKSRISRAKQKAAIQLKRRDV